MVGRCFGPSKALKMPIGKGEPTELAPSFYDTS